MRKMINVKISVLKNIIIMSKDAGDETKKACLAMIDASDGLTKPVFFTGFSEDIVSGVHNMISAEGKTQLSSMLKALGTDFRFSHHKGHFSEPGAFQFGLFSGKRITHTLWLSLKAYDRKATEVLPSELEKIQLIFYR